MDWPVVFRTHSEIEASIVRGLLETHGIDSIPSTGPALVDDLPVQRAGTGRSPRRRAAGTAEEAVRIIAEHREQVPAGVVVSLAEAISGLERRIGYRFRDTGLLEHALTHKSRAHEDATGGVVDNESLEFLGDAVLGFVIADLLYHEFPQFQEGQKSKAKAAMVSTAALAALAERIGLGDYLLLGRGEEKTGGRRKLALLADGCEAVIAALYLDGGIEQARAFILRELARGDRSRALADCSCATTSRRCRNGCRRQAGRCPITTSPASAARTTTSASTSSCASPVEVLAESEGRTKKEAEQEAARLALEILRDDARR